MIFALAYMAYFVLQIPESKLVQETIENIPAENPNAFKGRMVMPDVDDIYVFENSSGRDLERLERYLQGRAAGLHYLSSSFFKRNKNRDDVSMGIRMTLDSLGRFTVTEFLFANHDNEDFKTLVQEHIQQFWRYPKSTTGKLDFWIPVTWRAIHPSKF